VKKVYELDLSSNTYYVDAYALAYLLIIALLMEAIVTADWASSGKPEAYDRVRRIERPFLVGQFLILTIGTLVLILF
jgi:hypothetical protein